MRAERKTKGINARERHIQSEREKYIIIKKIIKCDKKKDGKVKEQNRWV